MITGTKQAGIRASFQDTQETLVTLASDTGGKAMLDTNDLSMGIRQAQEDIGSYYIIGYYSKNETADGKFRRIKVNLLDKNISAKLDYRTGYYAGKQFKNFNSSDKERQLEEALTLGDPVSELPLALEVDYFRVAKERYSVPISVKIPGSAVGLTKKGAKQTVDFDFIGQVRDASGKLVGGVRDNITVKLNDTDAEKIGRRYLQYDSVLTLAPGTYDLRFLARENLTGKMGTFETKFTVPDLSAAKSLRVSSVVLSNQKEPVSSAVGSADSNKRLLAAHPLVENGQKTVPSITRVFRGDQTLYVYGEVYDPAMDPDRKIPDIQADFALLRGGQTAYTSRPLRLNKLATSRPGVAQFTFQIPLAKLPPGQYISQVNVIDETGRKFAFLRNNIVLLAAAANTAPRTHRSNLANRPKSCHKKIKDERHSLESDLGVRRVVTGNYQDYIAASLANLYRLGGIFKTPQGNIESYRTALARCPGFWSVPRPELPAISRVCDPPPGSGALRSAFCGRESPPSALPDRIARHLAGVRERPGWRGRAAASGYRLPLFCRGPAARIAHTSPAR